MAALALEILAALEQAIVDYELSYPKYSVGTAEIVLNVQGHLERVWGRWRASTAAGSDSSALNSGGGESGEGGDEETHFADFKDFVVNRQSRNKEEFCVDG